MDISADRYWRVDNLDIGLLDEELSRLVAELADSVFGYGLARTEQRDIANAPGG